MGGFKGPSQEKSTSEIFRFGYGKASNDKKVPDPVGSEVFVLHLIPNESRVESIIVKAFRFSRDRELTELPRSLIPRPKRAAVHCFMR